LAAGLPFKCLSSFLSCPFSLVRSLDDDSHCGPPRPLGSYLEPLIDFFQPIWRAPPVCFPQPLFPRAPRVFLIRVAWCAFATPVPPSSVDVRHRQRGIVLRDFFCSIGIFNQSSLFFPLFRHNHRHAPHSTSRCWFSLTSPSNSRQPFSRRRTPTRFFCYSQVPFFFCRCPSRVFQMRYIPLPSYGCAISHSGWRSDFFLCVFFPFTFLYVPTP